MRRVLFGTGFPQVAPVVAAPTVNPDDCLQIMDLRSLNAEMQSYTRFITIYAWQLTVTQVAFLYAQVGSETPYFVGRITANDAVTDVAPSRLRFALRGNARLFITSSVNEIAIFGYYELETDQPVLTVPRPLQPSDPVSPFTIAPIVVAADSSAPVHAFEEDYVDLITIDFIASTGEALGVQTVEFPNGVALLLPITAGDQYNLMSGIPMLPDAADQVITAVAPSTSTHMVISGTFSR